MRKAFVTVFSYMHNYSKLDPVLKSTVGVLLCVGGRSHEAYSSSFVYVCMYVCMCPSVGRISSRSLNTKR